MTKPQQVYDRHSTVGMNPVLELIRAATRHASFQPGARFKEVLNGQSVKVSSLRLQTFATHGTVCHECGFPASFFAIERDLAQAARNGGYHLNLYGVNDEGLDVLFTHDHIIARALGGKDRISNTRTCCYPCNNKKAGLEGEIAQHLRLGASFSLPSTVTAEGIGIAELLEIYRQLGPVPGSGYSLEDNFPGLSHQTFFQSRCEA